MEVQLTDFENAAFVIFIVLLSRAILAFNLNFYIPISKVGFYCFLPFCHGQCLQGGREHVKGPKARCCGSGQVLLPQERVSARPHITRNDPC